VGPTVNATDPSLNPGAVPMLGRYLVPGFPQGSHARSGGLRSSNEICTNSNYHTRLMSCDYGE